MNTLKYVIFISIILFVIGLIYKMVSTYLWNRKLRTFQRNNNVKQITPIITKSALITKIASLVLISGLSSVLLFSQNIVNNNPANLSAKSFNTTSELEAFIANEERYYFRGANDFISTDLFLTLEANSAPTEKVNTESEYLDTNVQVEGVMEADIIKTDGNNIYYAPRYDSTLTMFEVLSDKQLFLKKSITLENKYFKSLFLTEQYLVSIVNDYNTYDHISRRLYFNQQDLVIVYDKTNLEVVYKFNIDASFKDYRMIDNMLYLVGEFYSTNEYLLPSIGIEKNESDSKTYNLDPTKVFYYNDIKSTWLTLFISIDLNDLEEDVMAFLGYTDSVYMNKDTIVVTQQKPYFHGWGFFGRMIVNNVSTRVIKFNINNENKAIEYRSYYDIDGVVNNQLWIDVEGSHLRIASSDPYVRKNYLYILKDKIGTDLMLVVGELSEGLGKENETIKSVTFSKNEVRIVTFFQTDPLYTIDLTDPKNPTITNSIEEEGFSSYLHLWDDEGHVIGLGFSVNEWTRVTGLKVSAYQTKDQEEPLQTVMLDNVYGSEQFYNHRALLVSTAKSNTPYQFIGFSIYGNASQFLIYMIDFTKEEIISEAIIIDHEAPGSYVDRGVYINGMVYTFSRAKAVSFSLEDKLVKQSINLKD